ncbi:hypothetical protein J0X19_24680 [Hymenobacter sp. BT186]|uniref:Uncharacterized protein n=1 Tax=Hymenobacter telluris TaxID=2816474 RepID=A0A939F2J4_9BACT|nr:hypothetical protein [Hymenobacter telluris]MBO0361177.1 hypothetical protein [Hymenobacter telluris]MBW3377205.1 hypothetical protein [Hymenobacter norwichensis]
MNPTLLTLAPALTIQIRWSERLRFALCKHIGLTDKQPKAKNKAAQALLTEWQLTYLEVSQQLQLFFRMTNSLPVIGDFIVVNSAAMKEPKALHIEHRIVSTEQESGQLVITYHLDTYYWDDKDSIGGRLTKN